MVPVCQVSVEHRGQRQGAHHHAEHGQHPGEAQAGAGHGHCQLNTEPGESGGEWGRGGGLQPPNITTNIEQT